MTKEILELSQRIGLDVDCGIAPEDDETAALGKLDNHLCELKELQIRDGLHVFGVSPRGGQLTDLLVALTRLPRGDGTGGGASLTRAIAEDLALPFDPLDCDLGAPWPGPISPTLPGRSHPRGTRLRRPRGLSVQASPPSPRSHSS